ncbi:hypothetical protein C8Q76DRAFT_94141 [Earliella scabrosa]|nr:hypothetical protein C8Q76DRAFT_94141 [Earliella scabrosa]
MHPSETCLVHLSMGMPCLFDTTPHRCRKTIRFRDKESNRYPNNPRQCSSDRSDNGLKKTGSPSLSHIHRTLTVGYLLSPHREGVDIRIIEPAMFVASSLLHFNNAHRSGVVQNVQPTAGIASSSRASPSKASSSSRPTAVAPLTSSNNRVVNTATPQPVSNGASLRDWIVKPGDHRAAPADSASSKGKGKAKTIDPASATAPPFAVKSEPGSSPVKLEPPSTPPTRPNTAVAPPAARKRSDLQTGLSRVKVEPGANPVKREPPDTGSSRVKVEPGANLVKLEPPDTPFARPSRVVSAPAAQARPRVPSDPSWIKPEPGPEPAPVKLEPSSSTISASRLTKIAPTRTQPVLPSPSSVKSSPTACTRLPGISSGLPTPLKSSPTSTPYGGQPASSGSSVPSSASSTSGSNSPPDAPLPTDTATKPTAVKRRLGMGRATGGYSNKKFKPMVPNGS